MGGSRKCAAMYCEQKNKLFEWPNPATHPVLHKAWTAWIKCDRKDFVLKDSSRICCKHFKEECFANLHAYIVEEDSR